MGKKNNSNLNTFALEINYAKMECRKKKLAAGINSRIMCHE